MQNFSELYESLPKVSKRGSGNEMSVFTQATNYPIIGNDSE